MSLISVIIPVYNVEEYLEQCIESVLKQSYRNIEVILIDDGSTDKSGEICDEYSKKESRIKIIHQCHEGVSFARNAGIAIAKGKYITFVDSDDYIEENMIECLFVAMDNAKADISICSFTTELDKLDKNIIYKYEEFSNYDAIKEILLERKISTSPGGKLYKLSLFDEIKFPLGKIYEDYGTIYKIFDISNKIVVLDTYKYFYRYNPNSITKVKFNPKRMEYFDISDEVIKFLKSYYPKLVKYAVNRETRYAISFFKQISQSGYKDKKIIKYLTAVVRKTLGSYILSDYKLTSKIYGICIFLSPKIALLVFKGR